MYTSRQGLETLLRRLVLEEGSYPNIKQIVGTVTGIIPKQDDHSMISRVVIRTVDGTSELESTLVADCTGVSRAGIKWLERAGYGYADSYTDGKLPLDKLEIAFDQKLQYSSITFCLSQSLYDRLPVPDGLKNSGAIYTFLEDQPNKGRRFFVITKPDGNRVMLFGGQSGDDTPKFSTLDDMVKLAQSLVTFREPVPEWVFQTLEMLRDAEDKSTPSLVRVPGTGYVRYNLATNLPSNFVALGDSVMTIDPTFSQGCTKALVGAICLSNVLKTTKTSIPCDFSIRFFKEHYRKTDFYWQTTRLMNYGIPCTTPINGESLSSGSAVRSYIRRMQILAIKDEQAALAVFNAAHGFGTPLDAFHPKLVLKVLWDMLRRPDI